MATQFVRELKQFALAVDIRPLAKVKIKSI
jgi:hypothetical protein